MGSTKAVRFQKYLVDSTSKLYQAFAFTEIVIIIIIIIHQDSYYYYHYYYYHNCFNYQTFD